MICPDCLEEYEFLKFDVDPVTLEHRGMFRCQCSEALTLPEFMTRDILADEDLQDQLRRSRMFHLQRSLSRGQVPVPALRPGALRLQTRHLERYLERFSEESLRQLK